MKRCEKATWNKPAGRYRKLIVSLLYSSSLNWNPSSSLHLFIIIRFFPPFVKTIDLENVPKKKEEVTRSQPRENLFFLCSGCQPSSGRLRAPRAPHRFAPTGVFPPVIFRVHGPRLHHNGGHKAQITGPRVDCCFCFLPFVSDKIRSWGSLSQPAVSTQKKMFQRPRTRGGWRGGQQENVGFFQGPGSTSKWTRLRQKTLLLKNVDFLFLFWRKRNYPLDDFSLIFWKMSFDIWFPSFSLSLSPTPRMFLWNVHRILR